MKNFKVLTIEIQELAEILRKRMGASRSRVVLGSAKSTHALGGDYALAFIEMMEDHEDGTVRPFVVDVFNRKDFPSVAICKAISKNPARFEAYSKSLATHESQAAAELIKVWYECQPYKSKLVAGISRDFGKTFERLTS